MLVPFYVFGFMFYDLERIVPHSEESNFSVSQ